MTLSEVNQTWNIMKAVIDEILRYLVKYLVSTETTIKLLLISIENEKNVCHMTYYD